MIKNHVDLIEEAEVLLARAKVSDHRQHGADCLYAALVKVVEALRSLETRDTTEFEG